MKKMNFLFLAGLTACTAASLPDVHPNRLTVVAAIPALGTDYLGDFQKRHGQSLARHMAAHAKKCLAADYPEGTEFLAVKGGNKKGQAAGFTIFHDKNGNRAIDDGEVYYEGFGKFSPKRVVFGELGQPDHPATKRAQLILRQVAAQANSSKLLKPLEGC